jgi:hypothetical protein
VDPFFLGGFVAGEGSFCKSTTRRLHVDGSPILRFVFSVQVEIADLPLLETLRFTLGVGSIGTSLARREGWQPLAQFQVNSMKAHKGRVIPFFDAFLLPSAKRDQFERWRRDLEEYVEQHNVRSVRGRSKCSKDGCERDVRGRGLCRSHYYLETGY